MTNTYDTSNFLPCPFCGAKPKAIDWPGGPMAKVFIHCPNDNYDSEDGGCSVGPDVVGSDMEDAAARWNRRQSQQAQGEAQGFTDYDAGALNDWGGGDVGWWQDYIRSEIERANDHWREQTGPEPLYLAPPAPAAVPEEATPEMEQAAERYWNERRFKGLTNDPRTWAGVYRAMVAPAPQPTPAAVPDGWKMVPVEPTDHMSDVGMVSAGIDITENDARHVYSAMLTASPAPEHAEEADVCQNCETALPEGCGGIFAHTDTACRYDENQQEDAER